MNYETVTLQEKTLIGFCARTNNACPEMGSVIGGLWQKLYAPENFSNITGRINEKAIGLYTDYSSDEKGDYTVMAAFEVNSQKPQEGFEIKTIPAGKYAKFIVRGNMVSAVAQFWQEIWKIDLDRSYVCDFEEYQNADPENSEIHIFIGINC